MMVQYSNTSQWISDVTAHKPDNDNQNFHSSSQRLPDFDFQFDIRVSWIICCLYLLQIFVPLNVEILTDPHLQILRVFAVTGRRGRKDALQVNFLLAAFPRMLTQTIHYPWHRQWSLGICRSCFYNIITWFKPTK